MVELGALAFVDGCGESGFVFGEELWGDGPDGAVGGGEPCSGILGAGVAVE